MKSYEIKVDGYLVGVVELTREEVREMQKDKDIIIKEVKG